MLARVQSFVLLGIDASPCEVEIHLDETGLGKREMPAIVGLPDPAVRESTERVKAALTNSGFVFDWGRMVVNLAPADVRKEGSVYELPMAVGMLIANGIIGARKPAAVPSLPSEDDSTIDPRQLVFAGELALDGRVRPIRGVIALAAMARARGYKGVIVPAENAAEAAVVEGIESYGVRTLAEVVGLLSANLDARPHPSVDVAAQVQSTISEIDFAEVRGQEAVKRAMVVAAAGAHNILMLGPPGTGKTMMAKALPGILPSMTAEEALEVTRIYSAAGKLVSADHESSSPSTPSSPGLITRRPVRTPHHTASAIAVIGGGIIPKPGEISLAHRGILFLDELAEFPRNVLDTLRQPLEDGIVTISRAHASVRFPAGFMLVAAMNPTPKGTMPDSEYGRREMERYLSKISGPLIDRVDIHIEVPAVPWKQLAGEAKGTNSATMREKVHHARERQHTRQGTTLNARLSGKELDRYAPLDEPCRTLLGQAMTELGLSARAYDKVRRVARTIADLDQAENLRPEHISEAIGYRLLDRKV